MKSAEKLRLTLFRPAQSNMVQRSILIGLFILMCSCDKAEQHRRNVADEYQKKLVDMEKTGIIAGPSEPTFGEKHGIRLHLPLLEIEFLRILDTLKLNYHVFAERDTDVPIPMPWHSEKLTRPLNLDNIQKVYQITGEIDHAKQSREQYRAYVDRNGFVVYLENTYAYSGP